MKTYLALGLLSSLLLTSCSIDWNDAKEKKIGELEKQVTDDTFKKKQECAKLESEMRKQLESNERYGNRISGTELYLSKVFYSPIKKSCLYKSEFIVGENYKLELNDYLTKEVIFEKMCIAGDNNINGFLECSKEFENKIKEFKGE